MTPEKMIEIPEWLVRKLIEVLVLELEETRDLLKLKECEVEAPYGKKWKGSVENE